MMANTLAIAAAVVADALRRKVVYVVGVFAIVLAMMIPQLPTWGMGVVQAVFREVSLALTFVVALVLTLSLSANRVPGEIEHRTVYNVLSKRVHRWEYVVGTWLGIVAVVAGAIAAFTLVTEFIGLLRYGVWMWRLWEGALAIWFEMGVVAGFALAVSTVTGPVVVVTATLVFLFIAHSRGYLFGDEPTGVAAALYPSLDAFNVINPVAHGTGYSLLYAGSMLLVFLGWCGLVLLLGTGLFSRRDL